MNRLFVGNIPFTKSEEALAEWFGTQGFRTRAVEIMQDRATSRPRGFGFVELEGVFELAEPLVGGWKGVSHGSFALGVKFEKLVGHILHGLAHAGFCL